MRGEHVVRVLSKYPRLRRGAAAAVLIALIGVVISALPPALDADETLGLALLFSARGAVAPPDDVLVVAISRDAARNMGQSDDIDEWPRELHAALIDRLVAAGAKAIAFDIVFEEPRSDDGRLATSIDSAGNVILVEWLTEAPVPAAGGVVGIVETRHPPVELLRAVALATAPFILPKVPVRVNQFWTFGRGAGDTPSLPVAALQAYLMPRYAELLDIAKQVRPDAAAEFEAALADFAASRDLAKLMATTRGAFRKDATLAPALRAALDDAADGTHGSHALRVLIDLYGGGASRYLNFYGPPRTIRTIAYDVAASPANPIDVRGKTVFVGVAESRPSEELDAKYSIFSQRTGSNLSGVEIGATAFANLLTRRELTPIPMPGHLALVLCWGLALGLVVASPSRRALAIAAGGAALYSAIAYRLFVVDAVWLPMLVPLFVQVPSAVLCALVANYVESLRQRERVQTALGYYVPRSVVNRLAEQSVSAATSRELLFGTCLFTDVEEYTTVSEALRPEDLASLMNQYYRVIFDVVERHGGMVSDTSGDSMVAVWATAARSGESRIQACRAALELVDAVADFNRGRGGLQLPTRVGLESGEVLLGNIGAEQRYGYRAIGDIVNTASRLQGLNRLLGTRILLSEGTREGVHDLVVRCVGTFLLRGKRVPVRVHEPVSIGTDLPAERAALLESFGEALAAFEAQRWAEAERAFAGILERAPNDGPSAFYLERCIRYCSEPPRAWSGAISIDVK